MAREAPRRKQQHVDAQIIIWSGIARSDAFCRRDDTFQPPRIYRQIKIRRIASPLNFYESDSSATAGDEIDLAAWRFHPARQNPPALQPQIPRGQRFAPSAKAFPLGPAHFSSIARA